MDITYVMIKKEERKRKHIGGKLLHFIETNLILL